MCVMGSTDFGGMVASKPSNFRCIILSVLGQAYCKRESTRSFLHYIIFQVSTAQGEVVHPRTIVFLHSERESDRRY